jgi:hypothetical protein
MGQFSSHMPHDLRFDLSYKVTPGGCWEWQKSRTTKGPTGYGVIMWNRKRMGAHRYAFLRANPGVTIPKGWHICHRCDNPPCVNPAHLFLGTPQDNLRDYWKKRAIRGEAKALENYATLLAGSHRR